MNSNGSVKPSEQLQLSLAKLLNVSLLQRVSAEKWEQLTRQLLSQNSFRVPLTDVLLEETKLRKLLNDPLYPAYLARALSAEFVTAVDVLRALAKVVPELQTGQQFQRYPILRILTQAIALWRPSPAILPKDVQLVWEIEQILHRQETLGQDQVLFMEIMDAWNKLLTSQSIRPILKSEKKKDTDAWKQFESDVQELHGVASTVLPMDKAQEMETILGEFLLDLTTINGPTVPAITEMPKIPLLDTRAALMILFMSLALLPLCIEAYSQRETYGLGATDDIWTTIDLLAPGASGVEIFAAVILAAFDALSVVVKRNDISLSTFPDPVTEVALYQTLLVNRIPALLATRRDQYSIPPEDLEYSVLEVCTKVDPICINLNVTQMPALETDEPSDFPQKDFRQDFMYAMVKHGLLDVEAPSRILGIHVEEIPALLDVKQIVEDAGDLMDEEGAVERVVGGLAGLDGNQGVVVHAILDLVQSWVSAHDIHSLSMLSAALMKDSNLIDQIFLHTSIPSFIEPIREFLDDWTIDEEDDNVEHQPIYEQYNSILYLICFCVHRFGRRSTLDDPDGPGFVRTWLREFSKAKWLDMLSDEDSNAIGTWISALFDGDGISDDLVRMSPPYKWLLISTTLFSQSVSAYRQGVLQLQALKDGFEYFMHPFLQPCLLGAIHYLTTQIKTSTPETITPYLEILTSLLEFLSPTQQEDDIFSTLPLPAQTSRPLQILSPSILTTFSQLTLDQATPVKLLLDPIVETLRPYSAQLRPDVTLGRKDLVATVRGTVSSLAGWSAGWGGGLLVPPGVEMRYLGGMVRACGESITIRHIVDEMWAAERTFAYHAVVVAAMVLTAPYDIGFGTESLGDKFLLMLPPNEDPEPEPTGLNLGKSLGPLRKLVKTIMGWEEMEEKKQENSNGEEMVVD